MGEESPRTVPRLAKDTVRAWAATLVSTVFVVIVMWVFLLLVVRDVLDSTRTAFLATSMLTSFYASFFAYGALTWRVFRRSEAEELHRWVHESTPRRTPAKVAQFLSGGGATSLAVQAALFSLAGVLVVALRPDLHRSPIVLVSAFLVVVSGWVLVVAAYAVQYVRENVATPGLQFPGDRPPVWGDYAYLSIQVCTTFSTSDVTVTTTRMRKVVSGRAWSPSPSTP